jgi:serine phosphatase RsbU (regulator of sigma subunit)
MAKLILVQPGTPQAYTIDSREVVLGRQPDVDIRLDAREVSRRHARVFTEGSQFFIEDLGSSNGTYLNSTRLDGKAELHEQDQIRIGPYLLRFESSPMSDAEVVIRASAAVHTANMDIFRMDASRKLQAVLEIAHQLARSLNLDEVLPRLLEHLLRLFPQADRGLILMLEGDQLVVRAMKSRRPDRMAGPAYSRSVVRRVLEERVGIVAEDAIADKRFNMTETLSALGIRSLLCVPFQAHDGRPLGVLQLDRFSFGAPFTPEDLHLLTAVALQASVVLENAALHMEMLEKERLKRDLALAREIQEGFLPQELAPLAGGRVDLHARVYPALDVSGDFYDYFPLDAHRLAFTVADVSGKGIPAAIFMTGVRTLARHLAVTAHSPAAVLQQLNDALAVDNPTAMFVTMLFGIYDVAAGEAVLASGGHPPALVRRRSGAVECIAAPVGRLLGFSRGPLPLADVRVLLGPGDVLVLYTDGVTEAYNLADSRAMFGVERLQHTLASLPAEAPLEEWGGRIRAAIERFTGTADLRDDITLLLLRRPA